MNIYTAVLTSLKVLLVDSAYAVGHVSIRPSPILSEIVEHRPKGEKQEIRVLTASIYLGDRTVFHTHPFPVSLFILEGSFTLEMEARAPVTITAGQAMVEPVDIKMTGYNRSSQTMRAVIYYVSDPGAPFLHMMDPK